MIVFSAFLVVVAVGLLVAGVVTSKLVLVYVAIGVSGVSLLALGLGAILKRKELFGQARQAAPARPQQVAAQVPSVKPDLAEVPQPAAAPAGYGWSAAARPGPSQAGYLPAADSPPAAFGRPRSSAQQIWEWRGNLPVEEPQRPPAAAPASAGPFDDQPTREDRLLIEDEQPAEIDQETQELPSPEHPEPVPSDQPGAQAEQPTAEETVAEETVAEETTAEETVAEETIAGETVAEHYTAEDQVAEDQQPPAGDGAGPVPAEVDLLRQVTVVPGVPRYHSPQCILIRFMGEDDLDRMPLGEARQAGCTPCRACQPDQA